MNELDPAQALAFSRIRYLGNSDWQKTERQCRVIMAAFDKVKDSDLSTMLTVANNVFPYVTTDMTSNELLGYVKTISVDKITQVESKRIPVDGYYTEETINGMSVLVPDLTMNSQFLQSYIYGTEVNENPALNSVSAGGEDSSTDTGSDQSGYSDYDSGTNNTDYSGGTDYSQDYGYTDYSQDNGGSGNGYNGGGYADADGDGYDDNTGTAG